MVASKKIRTPYLILTDTNIDLVKNKKIGWLSSSELYSIGRHDSDKMIDIDGNLYELSNVTLGGLRFLGLLHIFNFFPLRRAPRIIEFEFKYETQLDLEGIKKLVSEHIQKFKLFADPDPGGGRGKYHIRDQVIASEDYVELFKIAELAMSRKYMKILYKT